MDSRNPVFARAEAMSGTARGGSAAFDAATIEKLEQAYAAPAAGPLQTDRLTYNDVIVKTGLAFVLVLVGAGIGWFNPGLMIVGFVGGLVLGLVNAFKKEPSPPLILAYAALMGVALGAISMVYQAQFNGIVQQAVLGTFSVFAVSLVAYRSGAIRVTPKFRRMVIIGMFGYLAFSVLNLVLSLVGVGDGWGLRNGWLGVVVGLVAVALAAFSLVLDFDFIDQGVQSGIPRRYAWTAAFGLVVTLVWLYLELLRLLAILQSSD